MSSTRFGVFVERVAEIELTVGCDSSDSKSPILIVQPSSVRRSVGQEEVKNTSPNDGDGSEDVEDELPS